MLLRSSLSSLSILITSFWTLHLIDCLSPFCLVLFLKFWSLLSFGPCFFVFSFWQPPCICFHVLAGAATSLGLVRVALYSVCTVGFSDTASPITQAGYSSFTHCVGCTQPSLAVEPSDTTRVLSRDTQPWLQSDLQAAATCVGLRGDQERTSCEPRPAALGAWCGTTSERYGARWSQMLLLWGNLGKHGPRQTIHVEKQLETAWVGLKGGLSRNSRNHQGGANSVIHVDDISDMMLPAGYVGGSLQKETMVSASTSLWRNLPPISRPDARQFSFFLCVSDSFQSAALALEFRGSKSE